VKKKLAGTGLAIGLVAGAGAGLILEMSGWAGAASGTSISPAAVVGDSTSDAATVDPAKPDPSTRLQEVLKPLVDDGTITQDQADKVIAALVAARPIGGPDGGRHHGRRGPGLDIVATTLGITIDDVRTALQSGQSIADLAVSKGKTAQDVIDAIVQQATTKLNAAVTAGDLTQAEADQRLADLTTRVTEFVNSTAPVDGPWGPGGFGGPGRPGHHLGDDDAPVDSPATTNTVTG
jgi:polyhydroxyalkanoate synthesis regulator phasin